VLYARQNGLQGHQFGKSRAAPGTDSRSVNCLSQLLQVALGIKRARRADPLCPLGQRKRTTVRQIHLLPRLMIGTLCIQDEAIEIKDESLYHA